MGMVGDHTYSTTRTPYCSAAAEVSTQTYALEEVPELFLYLFYNLAPVWRDYCVSLCSLDYGGGCFLGFFFGVFFCCFFFRKNKAQLSQSLKNRVLHFIVLTHQAIERLS